MKMEFLPTRRDERVPINVIVEQVLSQETWDDFDRRAPVINTGIQGEEWVWRSDYAEQDRVKIWNFGGTNRPWNGDLLVRWVSNGPFPDVPYDCSVVGRNADVKTVVSNRDRLAKVGYVFTVLVTPKQAENLTTYIVVFRIHKKHKIYVQILNCSKI